MAELATKAKVNTTLTYDTNPYVDKNGVSHKMITFKGARIWLPLSVEKAGVVIANIDIIKEFYDTQSKK